jgi:hypothetical protein
LLTPQEEHTPEAQVLQAPLSSDLMVRGGEKMRCETDPHFGHFGSTFSFIPFWTSKIKLQSVHL